MSYNGYRNWETWNLALWFLNDEALYRRWRIWAEDIYNSMADTEDCPAPMIDDLADCMEEEITNEIDSALDKAPAYLKDLLMPETNNIDFHEIAEIFINEIIDAQEEI
jgi:hypothetical protein